jgi:integrase
MMQPNDERAGLAPKTVYDVHLIICGALTDALRRGLISRNVALVALSPRRRSIQPTEPQSWPAAQLQAFLHAAAGHRLFPALWLSAMTGVRRSELIRHHDLRHTDGTLLIAAGVPAKVLSERLGHASPVFTIQTYQHVPPACRPTPRAHRSTHRARSTGHSTAPPSRMNTRRNSEEIR